MILCRRRPPQCSRVARGFQPVRLQAFPEWRTKTVNLLNCHRLRVPGDSGFYLVHMQEEGKEGVTWYKFGRKD
jgi:hypothetical protein